MCSVHTGRAWKRLTWNERREAAELTLRMDIAERHHKHKRLRVSLHRWMKSVRDRKRRQNVAMKKIQRVWNAIHCKSVLAAWRYVWLDSKRTKEYYERLEKGQLEMSDQHFDIAMEEGQDRLSLLPSKLSLKIFQHLGIGDLLKCAQVCQTWKAITKTNTLWSRIRFSVEKDWITDSVVVKILQNYRIFVIHLNMRGCISLKWPGFKCISEYTHKHTL
ncbi:hypothetical protein DPEC_G00165420 [Dallia pectoralis]|uniref:Uncharacterized protein n=1 Tax=Dallia pectoralis TaxID=75939 RepID=A0ACC2GH43_DALPE|nr:hypothetical protein DPEC_G00165420 [Dallia pectoralis]